MGEMDGVVDRVASPADHLHASPRIHSSREDNLLKKVEPHMVGTGESEKEAFFL